MATQFTSPFYLQELAGGLNFPVGAQRFRGPLVWRRLVAGGRAAEKSCFFLEKNIKFHIDLFVEHLPPEVRCEEEKRVRKMWPGDLPWCLCKLL